MRRLPAIYPGNGGAEGERRLKRLHSIQKKNRIRPKVVPVNKKRFSDLNLAPVDRMYLCEWAGFPCPKGQQPFLFGREPAGRPGLWPVLILFPDIVII